MAKSVGTVEEAKALVIVKRLEREVAGVFVIETREQFDAAGEVLTTKVKPAQRQAAEIFDPIIRSAHETHKAAIASKKRVTAPLDDIEARIKTAMADWQRRELARQREEADKLRLEAQAEADRMIEAAREELAEEGYDEETINEALDATANPAPIVAIERPVTTAGVSFRTVRRFEVVDVDRVDRAFMIPDLTAIQAVVNSMADKPVDKAERAVGGIRVYEDTVVSATSR